MKKVFKAGKFFLKFCVSAPVLGLILAIAYILGAEFLFSLRGNDTLNNLTYITWFGRFFPKIPLWFPLQGAGVSLSLVYPLVSHFMVILLERIADLPSLAAYQIIGFLSVPLTAFGVFLFVWLRLTKSQIAGLIAAVLYLISPISWGWLYDWGFFAEAVSYPFALLSLILIDTFLDWSVEGKKGFKLRLLFFLTCLSFWTLYFVHPTAFFGFFIVVGFYTFFRFGLLEGRKWKEKLPYALFALLKVGLITLLLLYFYFGPSFSYLSYTKRWGGTGLSKEDFIQQETVHLKHFFGLAKYTPKDSHYASRHNYFPIAVWSLAILGLLASVKFSKKALALGLFCLLALFLLFNPTVLWYLSRIPMVNFLSGLRIYMTGVRVLLPCLGAFGAWAFWFRFFSLPLIFLRRKKIGSLARAVIGSLAVIPALAVSGFLIWHFRTYPYNPGKIEYGPRLIDLRDIFDFTGVVDPCQGRIRSQLTQICSTETAAKINFNGLLNKCDKAFHQDQPMPDICPKLLYGTEPLAKAEVEKFLADCKESLFLEKFNSFCQERTQPLIEQLKVANWPRPPLGGNIPRPGFDLAFEKIEQEKGEVERIDISPTLGGVVMEFNIFHEASMVNLYAPALSLISPFWGYQQVVFYGETEKEALSDLAHWFGTSYAFLNEKLDHVEKYQEDSDWEKLDEIGIWKFLPETSVFAWEKKPTILVIGSQASRAFEPVFKVANLGAIPYDQAVLVSGEENIDDYSLSELKKFDLVFLFGYSYKNQRKAFQLLDQYLAQGGNLLISTGWQYKDKDWERENLPPFFPMGELSWSTELGKATEFELGEEFTKEIDPSKISPLIWADEPWGVSLPEKVRSWARPVLSTRGQPLILTGEYGKGRVAWMGINLPAHILTFDKNPEEVKLLNQVISWLLPQALGESEIKVSRDWPDRVEITLEEDLGEKSFFIFKEAFHPYWRASITEGTEGGLRTQKLKIYETGPALMGVFLPSVKKGDKLIFSFSPGLSFKLTRVISLITFLTLMIYLFKGRVPLPGQGKIKKKVKVWAKKTKESWEREDEY